ncbi:MAG: TonB-dependent receptor [Gemmatimonadetes bacterium]|nr:TonB-dependent receptor [Gemmatimonadota bacterium]
MNLAMVRTSVLLAGLLATGALGAEAQQTRTISGLVRDSTNGETLPFAAISVRGTAARTMSNRDGYFTLLGVPTDSFTLRVTFVGYGATDVAVPAGANPDRIVIGMSPIPFRLDEITVVADDYRIMRTGDGVSRITASPRDMAVLPSVGEVDIFRSLQLLPGISGTNESSSGLFVRGGTPDQNLVLLDGMTVYHVDHFFGFFSAFNADAIKDVQVFKSAFPAQYGGRVSSVVDMTGKTGDPNRAHASLGMNLLSAQASVQVPLFRKGSVTLTARRSYTDLLQTGLYNSIFTMFQGEEEDAIGATGAIRPGGGTGGQGGPGGRGAGRFAQANFTTTNPDFYFYDVNGKVTYRPTDSDVLSISLYSGQDYLDQSRFQSTDLTTQGNLTRGITTDITDLTNWGNKGVSGKWARQWDSRLYTNVLLAYSEYFSDYNRRNVNETRDAAADTLIAARSFGSSEDNQVGDLTIRMDNEWQALRTHKIDFGGWFTRSDVQYLFLRDDTTTVLDSDQDALRLAGYVQDTWSLGRALNLTLGGRAAYYDQTAKMYLEPRASAAWRITNRVTLKGAYGRYHQFVNRVVNENVTEGSRDFWLLADGDLVDVTSSQHYVAGASYETNGFLVDVEAYRKDLQGLSEFSLRFRRAGEVSVDNLFFEGTGVAQGVEFLVQKKTGAYTGWVSYTLSRVEHQFPDLNDGEPFPALHDQTHEAKLVNSISLGRWSFSGTWVYGTGKPYTAPESEYAIELLDGRQQGYIHVSTKNSLRLPAYHRADIAAHFRFNLGTWKGDVGLSVLNLYNRNNVWYREFDLTESPVLVTDVRYLGVTPNLSVRFEF